MILWYLTDLSGRHVRPQVCRISWDTGRFLLNDRLLFAALLLSHLKGFASFVSFISISDNRIGSLSNNDGDGYQNLKGEFALLQTLSRLFHLAQFFKCWQIFPKFNSKRRMKVQEKEKKVVALRSRPTQNVKLGTSTS